MGFGGFPLWRPLEQRVDSVAAERGESWAPVGVPHNLHAGADPEGHNRGVVERVLGIISRGPAVAADGTLSWGAVVVRIAETVGFTFRPDGTIHFEYPDCDAGDFVRRATPVEDWHGKASGGV